MNTTKLTAPPLFDDDSTKIAELTIALQRIHKLASTSPVNCDELLYLIRYEAENGLTAARALSEPAVVS